MIDFDYWRRQEADKPLFPDVEWNRPERKDQAGRLGVIGGNSAGFAAVADSYQTALSVGAGQVRILLPDCLKKSLPASVSDAIFAPTNQSGGLANDPGALAAVSGLTEWSDVTLLIGDAGKNSQTAILYGELIKSSEQPVVLTRNAIDLVQNDFPSILDNPRVVFVASFAQVQKLFRSVYYPKMLNFSMQLAQFVEALHKFTITHPVTIVTLHADNMVIAREGQVVTQNWDNPMAIWRGTIATRAASYLLWTPTKPLEAVSSSLIY